MRNDNGKKLQKTLTPAQESARVAEEVEKKREAQKDAYRKELQEEEAARRKVVEAEAEKQAPEIYQEYRRLIAEAEKVGQRSLQTDREHWSATYFADPPEISPEESSISNPLKAGRAI